MARKGVSFAMEVLIVVIVIMLVALAVLSIFAGGIGNLGGTITQLLGGAGGTTACSTLAGQGSITQAACQTGTACDPGWSVSFGGSCPAGQICCIQTGTPTS